MKQSQIGLNRVGSFLRSSLRLPQNLFMRYNNALLKRPLPTKMATYFTLFGIADSLSQYIIFKHTNTRMDQARFEYNGLKALKFATFGGFVVAPFMHYYLTIFIEWLIPGRSVYIALKKVAFDQVLLAPIMIHWSLFVTGVINGLSIPESLNASKDKGLSTLTYCWRIWPFVHFINFTVMPIHLRVFFVNIVSVFWTTFLSYQGSATNQQPIYA